MILLEACVDTLQSAINAQTGGADRVELCDNLSDGGTTPSHGMIALVVERLAIAVLPIIRPRGGGFVYDADELAIMRHDVAHARRLGAHGIVIGALTPTGDIDETAVRALQQDADGLPITFHRAFDAARDPFAALEALIGLGIARILTSGQRATAWEGRATIAALARHAAGRIEIVAGGSVDETNAADLVRLTGVRELHVRGTTEHREPIAFHENLVPFRRMPPAEEGLRSITDASRISEIRRAIGD